MVYHPFDVLAPHYCCSCGQIGAILCQSCFYDISSEPDDVCLGCGRPIGPSGACRECQLPYGRGWAVGVHDGVLRDLIARSKFEACRQGCDIQAALLHARLPMLPSGTVVVPVPTIARHIRQRGYAHAERIAKQLAKLRHLPYCDLIGRREQFVQHGASRKDRLRHAARSFELTKPVDPTKVYLVIDDVVTTGATIEHIAKLFVTAGVPREQVWIAITSRRRDS